MSGAANRQCVLLVDDDPRLLSGLRRAFRLEPYEVLVAETATAALWLMSVRHVDVVVTDHHMPGLSGVEFLARVRRRFPHVVSIMLTAHVDVPTALTAINSGEVFRLFTKPCDTVSLAAAIREALRRARLAPSTPSSPLRHGVPPEPMNAEVLRSLETPAAVFEVEPTSVNLHDLLEEIEATLVLDGPERAHADVIDGSAPPTEA